VSTEDEILPGDIKCPNCFTELELDEQEKQSKKFTCPNCKIIFDFTSVIDINSMTASNPPPELTHEWAVYMENKIAWLEFRIQEYESLLPKTNILSANFWNRAWAVFGHQFAISAILFGTVILIMLVLMLGRIH
jgi:hypothetical protein